MGRLQVRQASKTFCASRLLSVCCFACSHEILHQGAMPYCKRQPHQEGMQGCMTCCTRMGWKLVLMHPSVNRTYHTFLLQYCPAQQALPAAPSELQYTRQMRPEKVRGASTCTQDSREGQGQIPQDMHGGEQRASRFGA